VNLARERLAVACPENALCPIHGLFIDASCSCCGNYSGNASSMVFSTLVWTCQSTRTH